MMKFSKNYKPLRNSLWLIYKITKNNDRFQLFAEFVPTKEMYLTPCKNFHICHCDFNVGRYGRKSSEIGGGKGYDS